MPFAPPAVRARFRRVPRLRSALSVPLWMTALLLAPAAPAASVYKWVDAQDRVHYDDRHVQEQRLTLQYLNDRAIPAQPESITPRAFVAAVEQDCRNTQDRAMAYRAATALYGRDPAGNGYRLSPRQQALEVAQAEREAARYCAPGAAETLYRERRSARIAAVRIPVEDRR